MDRPAAPQFRRYTPKDMNTENDESPTKKSKCMNCGADILLTTYDKTGGYCIPCKKMNTPWYKISKYISAFGGITSGIFGLIIGLCLGYSLFGTIGAVICGILGFLICFG